MSERWRGGTPHPDRLTKTTEKEGHYMLAIIIPAEPNEAVARDAVPTSPEGVAEWLRAKIGGPLERVQLSDNRAMWVSETGKLDGLPVNVAATGLAFLNGCADVIAGPAVILAHAGPETIGLNRDQFLTTWAELHAPITVVVL